MKPHKHAAVIKLWADGATVQYRRGRNPEGEWTHVSGNTPSWSGGEIYRASIAEVEGKPVFEGDTLYLKKSGAECVIFGVTNYPNFADDYSWNPPKKTITVTIPRPDNEVKISTYYYPALAYTNPDDQAAAIEAIKGAME